VGKLGPYELNTIVTGDCRELAKAIPDESVDLILCDPEYNQLWQYEWLGRLAGRILRPGGNVVAQAGNIYRFRAECTMQNKRLAKRPLVIEVFTGGLQTLWMHRALSGTHPYIWLEKEPITRTAFVPTFFYGRKDKTYHEWGDGVRGFSVLMARLSSEGDIVLDPFTGGGTVPVACKMLGRKYLAFEIDPATADLARHRVANTNPPLFTLAPEQQELW